MSDPMERPHGAEPVYGTGPADPVGPADGTSPVGQADPVDPAGGTGSTDPADPGFDPGVVPAADPGTAPAADPGAVAPAASELPGRADSEGWRRMHPLTPLMKGGIALLVIVGIIIANLRDVLIEMFVGDENWSGNGTDELFATIVAEGLILVAVGAVLGLILLIVLFSWISWRVHTYRITDEAVENREGVLFKKHRRAPLERIQSVNLQRPLLARILGLTKIEVQTAGQGGKVELSYLGHRDAKTVREQIIRSVARSRGQQVPHVDRPEAADPAVPTMPGGADPSAASGQQGPPETAAVGHDGTAYAPAHGRLDERVQDFADFDIDRSAQSGGVLVSVPVGRLSGSILLSWEMLTTVVILIVIIGLSIFRSPVSLVGLIPLVLVMGSIMFGQFNKGFNFTLTRSEDGVRTGAGLTATNTDTVPLGRIHGVEALQPLGWRPLGWWKVRINIAGHSVAQGGQNASRNIVLPVGRADDVLRVFEALLPGTAVDEAETEELRDALQGSGSGYRGAGPRAAWVLWFGVRRAGVRLVARADGGASAPDESATLRIRRGALTRSMILMPLLRAQSVQLRRPFVHRMLGLASIQVHTVLGPVRVEMRGLELASARPCFDALARTVVEVQNGEAGRRAEQTAPRGES